MSDSLKVYCNKEKREVPVYWCLGSYLKSHLPCAELLEATVSVKESRATVKCKAQ